MHKKQKQNAGMAGARVDLAGGRETTNQIQQSESNTNSALLNNKSTARDIQHAKVLALLQIADQTTYSLRAHGIAQCAARVFELKAQGYPITKTTVNAVDSDGFIHAGVALYSLNEVKA